MRAFILLLLLSFSFSVFSISVGIDPDDPFGLDIPVGPDTPIDPDSLEPSSSIPEETVSTEKFEETTSESPYELIKDWKAISISLLILASILVALAYGFGIAFDLPNIKAWANQEMSQIIVNAILIVSLMGMLAFADTIMRGVVVDSGLEIEECSSPTGRCLQGTAEAYLDAYINSVREAIAALYEENFKDAALATTSFTISCPYALVPPCLQVNLFIMPLAFHQMDMDYNNIVFEYFVDLAASLESQKFFISAIGYNVGPAILALGFVARSFYITRKLGGLLIAIAIGVMFVLPAMYVFNWLTLDSTFSDSRTGAQLSGSCPEECQSSPPKAYIPNERSLDTVDLMASFSDVSIVEGLSDGTIPSAIADSGELAGRSILSCYAIGTGEEECPDACRILPYPSFEVCAKEEVQRACKYIPKECKYIPIAEDVEQTYLDAQCPSSCKIIPPLNNNCDVEQCLSVPLECRYTIKEILDKDASSNVVESVLVGIYGEGASYISNWRPVIYDEDDRNICKGATDCPASSNADESCVYVLPPEVQCDSFCSGCPTKCRIENGPLPSDCPEECSTCPTECKADLSKISLLEPCGSCPDNKRLIGFDLPEDYFEGPCSINVCPADLKYRLLIPTESCGSCLFADQRSYYEPKLNTRCDKLCTPKQSSIKRDAAQFASKSSEGMFGPDEILNISKLMLPAYILPLFDLVVTIVFIKGLSEILGGDIEIPGLQRLF